MNLNDTLDPQIADTLLKRPSLDDLSRFFAGLATPIEAELIEAHMQRSPEVRMDVEALKEDFDAFSESLHQSLREQKREAASHRIGARDSHHLALAAAEAIDLPTKLILETAEGLGGIPGLCCVASASAEAPGYATTFRLSFRNREEATGAPNRVKVKWPSGARVSRPFEFTEGRWRSDVVLPVGWKTVSAWLSPSKNAVSFAQDLE